MKKLIIFSLLLISIALLSCKKDSAPTKKEMLTSKGWILTGYTVDPSLPIYDENGEITGYTNDLYAQYEACDKDDISKFNTDGTMTDDEGASKCDPNAPQTTSGTWVFNTDQTIITVNFGDIPGSYEILELTSGSLKLKYVEDMDGINYTETITFRH